MELQHKMNHTFTKILGIFALMILVTGFASALQFGNVDSILPENTISPYHNATVTITNNDTETVENVAFSLTGTSGLSGLTVTPSNIASLAPGASIEVEVDLGSVSGFEFDDRPTFTLKASGEINSTAVSAETDIAYYQGFCGSGTSKAEIIEITKVDITNRGDNKDSENDEWFAFDDIEIEVRVENVGDDEIPEHDLDDVTIEIGIFNSEGKNIITRDFEFFSTDEEEREVGNMDPDDEEEHTFEFRLDEPDTDGSHRLVVKAYESGSDGACVDFSDDLDNDGGFSETISLEAEDDEEEFIRFTDIIVNPTQVTCSENVEVIADVTNIGDDEAENIVAVLRNSDLGIDVRENLGDDLSEGEREEVRFNFIMPADAQNRGYSFDLTSTYEVDDDPITSDVDQDVFINVIGCGVGSGIDDGDDGIVPPSTSGLSVLADLVSGGEAGDELVVSATFTNQGSSTANIIVDARNYQSWAELDSISERILTLDPGQSGTSIFTLSVNEDTSGSQSFFIETTRDGQVAVQEVEVEVESDDGSDGLFGDLDFGDNSLIWVIALVNIILIILIILVAVRLSRR